MKALLVYAHADDEIIFGWPFAFDDSLQKRLLICSCDEDNPDRRWCRRQREALAAVGRDLGIEDIKQMRFHSEFYRLPSRGDQRPLLKTWWESIVEKIHEMSEGCDFIATHNSHGEYGHMDHLLVRRAVLENTELPVKSTTAFHRTKTWPIGEVSRVTSKQLSPDEFILDKSRYERLKTHYTSRACFSWDNPVPNKVHVITE